MSNVLLLYSTQVIHVNFAVSMFTRCPGTRLELLEIMQSLRAFSNLLVDK